jgi:hypothetical protein
MSSPIAFKAVLTFVVLIGGGYVATRNDQPMEIRLATSAIIGGSVAWWFKSPLEDGKDG